MHACLKALGRWVGGGELQLSTDRGCLSAPVSSPGPCPAGPAQKNGPGVSAGSMGPLSEAHCRKFAH